MILYSKCTQKERRQMIMYSCSIPDTKGNMIYKVGDKNLEKNIALIEQEIEYEGLSVIIAQRPCVQIPKEKKEKLRKLKKERLN